jgi:hypothetical protein
LVIRPFLSNPVEQQLIAARVSSVAFLLITVLATYGLARTLTGPQHPLRWMMPAFPALLPPFVDLMSAVNNDAGAIAAFSLFLWGCAHWVRRRDDGWIARLLTGLWVITTSALCFAMKTNTVYAPILAIIALSIGAVHGKIRAVLLGLLVLGTIAAAALALQAGDRRGWYRTFSSESSLPTHCDSNICASLARPVAIRISPDATRTPYLFQSLPQATTQALAGKRVTVSAWMWADHAGIRAPAPWLAANHANLVEVVTTLSPQPTRITYTVGIPDGAAYVRLSLYGSQTSTVYYDDVRVQPLQKTGELGENAARFGTGAETALALRNGALRIAKRAAPQWFNFPLMLSSIQDPYGAGWYFQQVAGDFFVTFWARFGWGEVAAPAVVLWLSSVLSLIALAGALAYAFESKTWRHPALWSIAICALAFTILIVPAMTRMITWGLEERFWTASVRYLYPCIAVFAQLFAIGVYRWLRKAKAGYQFTFYLGPLIAVALISIGGVSGHYTALY